jgi:hypothetical protein
VAPRVNWPLLFLARSDQVHVLAQQQLERLYGPAAGQPGFQYVAVHLRLGGMEREASLKSSKGSSNGPLVDLVQGLTCIKHLGECVEKRVWVPDSMAELNLQGLLPVACRTSRTQPGLASQTAVVASRQAQLAVCSNSPHTPR